MLKCAYEHASTHTHALPHVVLNMLSCDSWQHETVICSCYAIYASYAYLYISLPQQKVRATRQGLCCQELVLALHHTTRRLFHVYAAILLVCKNSGV